MQPTYIQPPPPRRTDYFIKQIKDGALDQAGLEKMMYGGLLSQPEYQTIMATLFSSSPDRMATADHAGLYAARSGATRQQQGQIAPYEHRAFAREAVSENPWMALPIAAGIPMYQAYKGLFGARSGNSMDQVIQGFKGVGEGLLRSF